jgi:hypothetical protein
MFEIGDSVVILAPFGDESTPFVITARQGVNESGELDDVSPVAFQYEIDGVYYAEKHLRAA